MDTQQLHDALQATFVDPNKENRAKAEEYVMAASNTTGAVKAFYEIATAGHVTAAIQQAAAIRLKQIIRKNDWNADTSSVSAEEKQFVKSTILHNLANTCPKVQKQLCDSLMHIAAYEFPERWTDFPAQINSFLTSDEPAKNLAALSALRTLTKRYETVALGSPRRSEVENIGVAFFPTLLRIFQKINQMGAVQTAQIASLQRWILKIFFSANGAAVLKCVTENEAETMQWMEGFLFVLRMPLDETVPSQGWKTKKWVGYIIASMLEREKDSKSHSKQFHTKLRTQYCKGFTFAAAELLTAHNPLKYYGKPQHLHPDPKAVCRLIDIITVARGKKQLHNEVRPHLLSLLQEGLFPLVIFTEEQLEMFTTNPQEYVRKQNCSQISEDYANPSLFALKYIHNICENQKGTFHDGSVSTGFLAFLRGVLDETSDFNNTEQMRKRYAALRIIGALRDVLLGNAAVAATLEQFIKSHAIPMLTCRFGFMRSVAMWVASRFSSRIEWSTPETFVTVLQGNLALMDDSELPVRIEAGTSLQKIIGTKSAAPVVRPLLGSIVQKCFGLMGEVDAEQLVLTLELIVSCYGEELAGESVAICKAFIDHFQRISLGLFDEEEDGEGNGEFDVEGMEENMEAIAASDKCIVAVGSFVSALKDKGDVIVLLQPVLLPLLRGLLVEKYFDFFDSAVRLITIVTAHSTVIAPEFWEVFDLLNAAFQGYAQDEIKESVAPYDNFISKDCKQFLMDGSRLQKFGEFCQTVLNSEHYNWTEKAVVPELIEVLIQHGKPHGNLLNEVLPNFYDITLKVLSANPTGYIKVMLCNVVVNGLHYNAPLTLEYLEHRGATAMFFSSFIELLKQYQRTRDLKVAVLGILAVLEIGVSKPLPAAITEEMKVAMSAEIVRINEKRYQQCLEEDAQEDESDSDDSEFGEMYRAGEDDEDFVDDSGLCVPDSELQAMIAGQRDEVEGEAEFDELLLNDTSEGVWSLIDEVNESAVLEAYLTMLQRDHAQLFQTIVSRCNPDHLNKIPEIAQYGAKRVELALKINATKIN